MTAYRDPFSPPCRGDHPSGDPAPARRWGYTARTTAGADTPFDSRTIILININDRIAEYVVHGIQSPRFMDRK
jgi:hypothetical protein